MEQFNNLIEFRQAICEHGLTRARDAQFELLDALLLGQPIRSFPELSLLPVFRRKWSSIYAAIKEGQQDWEWLEGYFIQHIPAKGPLLFSLDGTAWPHPAAKTLADLQYVYSPTPAVDGGWFVPSAAMRMPVGAFITLGLLLALVNMVTAKQAKG